MKKILFFIILLLEFASCYAGDKPVKLSKLIYFQGLVDNNKMPTGRGKLILKRDYQDFIISGEFSEGKIANASYGNITGNILYSIDKENCSIIFDLYDVNIGWEDYVDKYKEKVEHVNIGKIKFEKVKSKMTTDNDFSIIVKHVKKKYRHLNCQISKLSGTEDCMVYSDLKIEVSSGVSFKCEYINEDDNNFYFADGSEYHSRNYGSDEYITKDGDKILTKDGWFKPQTTLITKDSASIVLDNYKIPNYNYNEKEYKAHLIGEVNFPNGSHFEGTAILNNFTKTGDAFMDVIKNCKSISAKQLVWYNGTFTRSDGSSVLFKDGQIKKSDTEECDEFIGNLANGGRINSLDELLEYAGVGYVEIDRTASSTYTHFEKDVRYYILKMQFLIGDHIIKKNGRCMCQGYKETTRNDKYYISTNRSDFVFNIPKSKIVKIKQVTKKGDTDDEDVMIDLGPAGLVPNNIIDQCDIVFVTTGKEEWLGGHTYTYKPVAMLIVERKNNNVVANISNVLVGSSNQYKSVSTVTVPDPVPTVSYQDRCDWCAGRGLDWYNKTCFYCGGKGYVWKRR